MKVYFIYGNEQSFNRINRDRELSKLGEQLNLEKIALTFVPSFSDSESEVDLNKINPKADNTIILYKRSRIIDKFINIKPSQENFSLISKRLDETINEYFVLPKLSQ